MDFSFILKSYRADDALRSFSPHLRNCYFEGEKVLKYFKTYTKALCDYECLTNHTLEKCGCVKFSMPRGKDTRICLYDELSWNLTFFPQQCNCLPSCSDLRYTFKYDKAGMNRRLLSGLVPDK